MPCMHCGQPHWSSRCKDIARPPEGFSKENGGGGHDHGDDEDEKAVFRVLSSLRDVQNGSQGGAPRSKQRVPILWNHTFPSTPSSVVV
jgi:hypothetical protein